MTIADAIDLTDKLTPNAYEETDKARWLLEIDMLVYDDLISTHDGPLSFYTPDYSAENIDEELLIPEPYAEDVSINFLQAKIAQQNREDAKYNKAVLFYNDGYTRFAKAYNAAHRPLPQGTYFKF